ncbi:MAG: triose-phosphate isomerase [Rhodospirillales bacterium]|nr:triose-phosphate isomerase [Rhodospirillales bacterium]
MSKPRRPLVAGNWKMNGLGNSRTEIKKLLSKLSGKRLSCDLLICPPATLLSGFKQLIKGSRLRLGGQDCHSEPTGAHTGDISAEMLADVGARFVIVGHSERRADHGETDATVHAKALAARRAGLTAIVCVGETAIERQSKKTLRVIGTQLRRSLPDQATAVNLVVAYEPVWAIGSGLTPTEEQIAEVHGFIRDKLNTRYSQEGQGIRILYGGSVKPENATDLLAIDNVDGALVGGASLKATDLWRIACSA